MLHSAHNQVNTANKKLTNWDSTSDLLLFRCMKNGKKTFNISQQQPGLSPWIHGASILDIRNTGSLNPCLQFSILQFCSSALCTLQVQITALCWLEIISVIDSSLHSPWWAALIIPDVQLIVSQSKIMTQTTVTRCYLLTAGSTLLTYIRFWNDIHFSDRCSYNTNYPK